jgi:hypothetical protein
MGAAPLGEWRSPGGGSPWGSPLLRAERKDASAAAEMAGMAEALGESLMAVDLPAVVAHKRRADALRAAPEDDDGVPPELLEAPSPGGAGRQPSVQAHRILTTARSMRSVGSSSERSSASAHAPDGGFGGSHGSGLGSGGGAGRTLHGSQLADGAEVKVLLLQALMAALPVMGAGGEQCAVPGRAWRCTVLVCSVAAPHALGLSALGLGVASAPAAAPEVSSQ